MIRDFSYVFKSPDFFEHTLNTKIFIDEIYKMSRIYFKISQS